MSNPAYPEARRRALRAAGNAHYTLLNVPNTVQFIDDLHDFVVAYPDSHVPFHPKFSPVPQDIAEKLDSVSLYRTMGTIFGTHSITECTADFHQLTHRRCPDQTMTVLLVRARYRGKGDTVWTECIMEFADSRAARDAQIAIRPAIFGAMIVDVEHYETPGRFGSRWQLLPGDALLRVSECFYEALQGLLQGSACMSIEAFRVGTVEDNRECIIVQIDYSMLPALRLEVEGKIKYCCKMFGVSPDILVVGGTGWVRLYNRSFAEIQMRWADHLLRSRMPAASA